MKLSISNSSYPVLEMERKYLSHIKEQSLLDLACACGEPLDSLTDMQDLIGVIYENGIKYLLHEDEFLDLPIIAHYFNEESESETESETFLIGHYQSEQSNDGFYRAITTNGVTCELSFRAKMPELEVKDSKYKTVRDILPLIDENYKI